VICLDRWAKLAVLSFRILWLLFLLDLSPHKDCLVSQSMELNLGQKLSLDKLNLGPHMVSAKTSPGADVSSSIRPDRRFASPGVLPQINANYMSDPQLQDFLRGGWNNRGPPDRSGHEFVTGSRDVYSHTSGITKPATYINQPMLPDRTTSSMFHIGVNNCILTRMWLMGNHCNSWPE
jgi:hypothetical protein